MAIDQAVTTFHNKVIDGTLNTLQNIPTTALSRGNIAFPATQSASADANTLDDYEEGTWTPTLTFATAGDLNVVYDARTGNYTKIGRDVRWSFHINTTTFTHTTASGNLQITGLPFTPSIAANHLFAGAGSWRGVTKANYTDIAAILENGSATLTFEASGSAQAVSSVAAADMPTTGTVRLLFSGNFATAT